MILLGIAGPAGAGKDTVAAYLVERYGFIRLAFADPLRDELQRAYGLPDQAIFLDRTGKETPTERLSVEHCLDFEFRAVLRRALVTNHPDTFHNIDTQPLSPRMVQQVYGTEYRRAQTVNYWLHRAEDQINAHMERAVYPEQRPQYFVFTDCRFENEQQWIHLGGSEDSWAGNLWHIHRGDDKPVNSHISTQNLPVLDGERELWNNDTIERLYKGIDLLITSTAQFVKVLPMANPEDVPRRTEAEMAANTPPLPNGQYYKLQRDGHMMLCNADGSRSIFDDVDE